MKPKEGTTDVLQNIGESLASPLETGTSLATGFTSGMAGGLLKGWNNLVTGQEGSFPQGFHEGAEALTYQPRLESAQENTQVINRTYQGNRNTQNMREATVGYYSTSVNNRTLERFSRKISYGKISRIRKTNKTYNNKNTNQPFIDRFVGEHR
jgi:hypothetical protein